MDILSLIMMMETPTKANCADVLVMSAESFNREKVEGYDPSYFHEAKRALAINAAKYRGTAAAESSFTGCTAKYDVSMTTLDELDGESSYEVKLGKVQLGPVKNSETDIDYKPENHAMGEGVKIKKGTPILVTFSAHTNGKIPEGDETAWSRGRWTQIVFTRVD